MSETKIWWYADYLVEMKPVKTTGPGYSGSDAEGREMYLNTHFSTEKEAWNSIFRNLEAWHNMAVRGLRRAEKAVEEEKADVDAAAAALEKARKNRKKSDHD